MLEKFLHTSSLFDFYGPLLTDKQKRCLHLHLYEDFSLSEISAELGISRQAVYDTLRRSELIMQRYEDKLGLASRLEKEKAELRSILSDLKKIKNLNTTDKANAELKSGGLDDIIQRVRALIGDSREA